MGQEQTYAEFRHQSHVAFIIGSRSSRAGMVGLPAGLVEEIIMQVCSSALTCTVSLTAR